MKRRLARLEGATSPDIPRHYDLSIRIPPEGLPDDQYDAWARGVEAEARRDGVRVISLNMGPLPAVHDTIAEDEEI